MKTSRYERKNILLWRGGILLKITDVLLAVFTPWSCTIGARVVDMFNVRSNAVYIMFIQII